jgi:hypothetical protein
MIVLTASVVYWPEFLATYQRSGFDFRRYQIFWEVVGLERGPLSLVSTVEKLLERKSSGSGPENREYGRRAPSRWPYGTLYQQKWALTSSTSVARSVGIVRSRTQATEFVCCWIRQSCDFLGIIGFWGSQSCSKNVQIFWDVAPYRLFVNRHFGGKYHLHLQGRKSAEQETGVQPVVLSSSSRIVKNWGEQRFGNRNSFCPQHKMEDGQSAKNNQ